MSQTPATATSRRTRTPLLALQVAATLIVASEFFQFVTAGRLFPEGGSEELHAGGAIVLHLVSGLALIAAFLHRRASAAPLWPTVLAGVVFVLTFVQAATGGRDSLAVHVPGAMVVIVGSVWLVTWSFSRAARNAG